MASRRRKVLTLEQRVKVIELSEKGESARRIAKKLEVGKTQIQSILLAKEEIKQELKDGASCTRKYRQPRHMLYKDIDAAVWEWFCIARGKGMSVSDPLLQQKAMMFSASLGHDEFTASNGWLQSFKRRHNIRAAALSGESGDIKDMTDWLKRVPALIQMGRYTPGDVFGVDETGLFFRALPSKMAWTGERCHDGEKSEERFTVLLACSATGEKLPPLIVGKSKAPQSFQNNLANVGISYRQNNRAWMTKVLFLEWLELVNKRMRTQNRKVLIILNKCAAHPDVELSNVELFFLPKNTMSCLQPLDTRIIQAVKLQYRKFLLHWAANASDECSSFSELAKDVSLFEAIAWLRSAWDSLKDSTIKQCFDHCGISFSDSSADEDDADVNDIAPELEALLDGVTLREFADMDNDLCTSYEDNHDDWEQRIVQRVKDGYPAVQDKDSDEEEAADSLSAAEAVPEVISSGEANKMVQQFERFPVASDCNKLLETLTKAQDLIQHKKFNEINCFHPKEMSEEQREALGDAHAQPMVVGGYQVYHSNADGDESSMNGEEDSEQSDPLGAVRVKFEPIDTEYDVEDEDENTMDELSSVPSTSRMPPRLHSQNVADLLHEGSSSMQTQIREMLSNKSVDSNTAAANVQNVIEALLKKNEDLLAQNDALGFKPNPRRGRVPGELGKHSQVVFPQVPGQFATFSAGGNTQGKISLSGSRSKAQQESASSVPMGRIVRPRSPTRRCSIPEKDKSHFSLALMESKVGDEDSEEIFQVQEHEMVCAVASKTKFLNIKDQVVASFDINFYWCNFCTFSTPNKALLLQHVMDHRFNCKYCRYQSFCRSDVVQHSVHTHPDFQEVAAVTQYCTLLSDYLRVKNPKLARLDSRHKRKRRRSPDRCDDSDQDSGQPPKLSRQYAPAGGRNAANPPPLRSANYNYYDVTIDMDESNEDRSSTPGPESQGKGGGSTSASASSSSSAVVTGSDSSHAAPPPNLRPQLAPSTQMAGQPVITQVFSAANFPHAPRVPSPLTPELPLSGNQRRSGAGSNSSSRSGSARASPSPSPAAAHSGGERASPQIRSNLYWSCGYCSFTSKSQSEIKDHSVRQHSGKPHRYVALIKPDGRSGGGDTGGSNSSTSVSNQGNEKDADGDSAAGNAAEGDEQGQPGGSSDTTGEPSQASQLPVTVSVKQEPEDSDEEIVPIKVRFPPARIQSKDTSSLRCFHCKYSSRLLGPLRNHILYNHKGSCLIGLGPMNCKVFMCPRADCTFRSSSGLTFLNHSRDCTPWSKPEARDVRVEPHLMTCLEETIQMAKETQGGSHQQPKVMPVGVSQDG